MNIIQPLDISILSLEDTYTKLNDAVLTAEKGRGESEQLDPEELIETIKNLTQENKQLNSQIVELSKENIQS